MVSMGWFGFRRMLLALVSVVFLAFLPMVLVAGEQSENGESIKALQKEIERLNRRISHLEDRDRYLDQRLDRLASLEISGAFDVSVSNNENRPNIFSIGRFELDIKHSYENNFQVAAALVFDDEEGTYLGVAFIDYSVFGDSAAPRGKLYIEKGAHIQVGRFDVPIGNDWNYVSAERRITVTPPLTTTHLMEGIYNDVGIRLMLNMVHFNASAFSTHGIENKSTYGGSSYGFRLGLTPFSNPYSLEKNRIPELEIGVSYLHDTDLQNNPSDTVMALDYQSRFGMFSLRSEYYYRDKTAGVEFEGYHLTSAYDTTDITSLPITSYLRYDHHQEKNNVIASYNQAYQGESNPVETLSRVTAGLNFNISNISYLKFELQKFVEASDQFSSQEYFTRDLYYAQLVITF